MADAISGIGAAAVTGKAAQDQAKLANDLGDFMTLLTTQLQHQDPLDPMDATEFTSQLVQFASVEQQIQQNSNLETLISAQEASQLSSVASYVGHYIEAESSSVQVYGGEAEFNYILHDDAKSTLVTLQDENGRTVLTANGEITQGKHGIVWDGTDIHGNKVKDGIYQLKVVAQDENGSPVDVTTTTVGVVTGVSYAGEEPVLMINNQSFGLDQVLTMKEKALQLSEVDKIASAQLKAKSYASSAANAVEQATTTEQDLQTLIDNNPNVNLADALQAVQDAKAAATTAASNTAEAAAAAAEATSSEVANQAVQNAAKAASDAAMEAAKAEQALADAQALVDEATAAAAA